jgi:hypothetical protein
MKIIHEQKEYLNKDICMYTDLTKQILEMKN